jgi:hypothetical protein
MIARFLFFLSAATATLLGLSAGAVTTSQSIDIIVTHGAPLTTFTFVNNSGNTLPAGSPVSFGQAFRYGDILPGTYPLIRDAATHVALLGQQWDEISTWRENGGNGSWRHAVWAARLPNSLGVGATYQVEFVATAGTYSQASHQALSALCSGPAAHDLKIHLTDVRNQNDTVRDSGDATFRVCDNIANVGRDAPRHLRAGNVYDEYQINGMFVYATSGHKDPLLYAQCIVDIFTKASDGVSPGDVRWVCEPSNSWENVAAGSTGNAGNPGPAGFANDPQSISYRPEVLDGATSVLNWSGLDATVASASNPMQPYGSAGCEDNDSGSFCMNVPSSTGTNQWYLKGAVRASCSATCVGGVTDGHLYYTFPAGPAATRDLSSTYVALMLGTSGTYPAAGSFFMTGSQGTGTTSFSFRVQHYHWSTWLTLDASGQDNWSPLGTTTRVTRKVYPAFTFAEKRYWQSTGLITPTNLAQTITRITPVPNGSQLAETPNYQPFGAGNVIGFQGTGTRPDLGISSEWAQQALIAGDEPAWDHARLFTLGSSTHGWATLINETNGRIPALNNGPPVGPGGNGTGGSYGALGAPQPQVTVDSGGSCNSGDQWYTSGVANIPIPQTNAAYPGPSLGQWYCGTYLSHMPSFEGFTYMVFGNRHWLDMMRWHANQGFAQQRTGPGAELGQGNYRDNNAVFTDDNTYHYYGILTACCQDRGSAWLIRGVVYAATFGSDSDIEKSYFNDMLKETRNYYPMLLKWADGPGNTNYSSSIAPPDLGGAGVYIEPFILEYTLDAAWLMVTWLHEPLGSTWMTKYQRYFEGVCGGQLAGAPNSWQCIDYGFQPQINDRNDGLLTPANGSLGQYSNGADASSMGSISQATSISGGTFAILASNPITVGDTFLWLTPRYQFISGNGPIDQFDPKRWYSVIGPVDNSALPFTFHVQCNAADHIAFPSQCPVADGAFTGFTRGGVPIVSESGDNPKYRFQYDPGHLGGYISPNYEQYGGQCINALHILGYNVTHALADFAFRDGNMGYNSTLPSNWWDPTVVIPGLPTPVNGL